MLIDSRSATSFLPHRPQSLTSTPQASRPARRFCANTGCEPTSRMTRVGRAVSEPARKTSASTSRRDELARFLPPFASLALVGTSLREHTLIASDEVDRTKRLKEVS